MNRNQLVTLFLRDNPWSTKRDATLYIKSVFECVVRAVERGETLNINKLGSIYTKTTEPRKGRNPQTGEIVNVPKRVRVRFKPSTTLKISVQRLLPAFANAPKKGTADAPAAPAAPAPSKKRKAKK